MQWSLFSFSGRPSGVKRGLNGKQTKHYTEKYQSQVQELQESICLQQEIKRFDLEHAHPCRISNGLLYVEENVFVLCPKMYHLQVSNYTLFTSSLPISQNRLQYVLPQRFISIGI